MRAAILIATLSGIAAGQQPTVTLEEIVAKVNGQIITRGELNQRQAAFDLRDQIDSILLIQRGKELGINVEPGVTRYLARIQSEQKISDRDRFRRFIEDESGQNFEDFRQLISNRMLSDRVKHEEVYRSIIIPKAEIDRYYNDHKAEFIREETVVLREILVSTGNGSPEAVAAAEQKAKTLVNRARKGEAKFIDLARQYSDAPTATADGELGAFRKGELAGEIDDVVFRNARGYITDPIRRPAGFEIYRIEDHYPAGQASEDEVEAEINARLTEPKAGPMEREYLTRLRQNAFLEIKPGYTDSAAAPGKDTNWQDAKSLEPGTTTKEAVAAGSHRLTERVRKLPRVRGMRRVDGRPPMLPEAALL